MAMTKKEREAMQAAIDRADLLAALRWTNPVERDVPPPKESNYTEGFDFNAHGQAVWLGWSGSVVHGRGPIPTGKDRHYSGSQGGRSMYSTEAKAYAAMRHEIEKDAARKLMMIDRKILDTATNTAARAAGGTP